MEQQYCFSGLHSPNSSATPLWTESDQATSNGASLRICRITTTQRTFSTDDSTTTTLNFPPLKQYHQLATCREPQCDRYCNHSPDGRWAVDRPFRRLNPTKHAQVVSYFAISLLCKGIYALWSILDLIL